MFAFISREADLCHIFVFLVFSKSPPFMAHISLPCSINIACLNIKQPAFHLSFLTFCYKQRQPTLTPIYLLVSLSGTISLIAYPSFVNTLLLHLTQHTYLNDLLNYFSFTPSTSSHSLLSLPLSHIIITILLKVISYSLLLSLPPLTHASLIIQCSLHPPFNPTQLTLDAHLPSSPFLTPPIVFFQSPRILVLCPPLVPWRSTLMQHHHSSHFPLHPFNSPPPLLQDISSALALPPCVKLTSLVLIAQPLYTIKKVGLRRNPVVEAMPKQTLMYDTILGSNGTCPADRSVPA